MSGLISLHVVLGNLLGLHGQTVEVGKDLRDHHLRLTVLLH